MKRTMPQPWRSRRDRVRRINMSSEPGNESFFCALRPIPRILSLRRREYASQIQIGEPSRRKTISGCSRAPDANRCGARALPLSTMGYVRRHFIEHYAQGETVAARVRDRGCPDGSDSMEQHEGKHKAGMDGRERPPTNTCS